MCAILIGKKPNRNTVRKAADHLIAIYGATTTLEVKKYLRALGYVAFQNDISQKMDAVQSFSGWAYTCNGQFRLYFIPQPPQIAQAQQAQTASLPVFSVN